MVEIDMDKPNWCGECPCYNHNSDTCRLTNYTCRQLWQDLPDSELKKYQNSICPMYEKPVSRWITEPYMLEETGYRYECSNCGYGANDTSEYCPQCGAPMIEPQESEDT